MIGITSEFIPHTLQGRPWHSNSLLVSYSKGIVDAAGAPVILPLADNRSAEETLGRLDGLVLSGGNDDIPAEVLGEPQHPAAVALPMERWQSECLWFQTALALNKPVLGVCLGMQVMSVMAGGKLIQDIPDQCPGAGIHGDESRMYRHEVNLTAGSLLARLAPGLTVTVTSSHHQAVHAVPDGYRLAALSRDGIVEAMEDPRHAFVIGVQWHPERDPNPPNWLLSAFVRQCAAGTGEGAARNLPV